MKPVITFLLLLFFTTAYSQDYKIIKSRLLEIQQSDQQYRIIIDSLVRKAKLDWNHPEIQKIIPLAQRQDSLNLLEVKQLLDKHGWLGIDKIGKEANETLFLVIQHADSLTMEHYFPLLVQSYTLGKSPAKHYALMIDRLLTERGQAQLYGTQMQMQQQNGKFIPFPIANAKEVDTRRKKLGLESLAAYLKKMNDQ